MFERIDRIVGELAVLSAELDADVLTGKQAQRVVCAGSDIERFGVMLKTLAMRRVDATDAWKHAGARSAQAWLANTTGTTMSDAYATVELAEQLEQLPVIADAARRGLLSPGKARMIADAASKDPGSETGLLDVARFGSVTRLQKECAAARQRGAGGDAMAQIHGRRSFRDWTDPEGAYRFEGTMTPDKGARFKSALEGFADQVFGDARRAGIRDRYEAYRADALVRMADAALATATRSADTDQQQPAVPRFTERRTQLVGIVDVAALERGYTVAGETCEIAGVGPVDLAGLRRVCGDAIVDIIVTDGVDVRTLAHAGRTVTRAQYAALLAEGYECNVAGCGNTRYLEIDHLGEGWAVNRLTCNGELAFKCTHCHDLKTYKGWTDGPLQPNGKRTLIPPDRPPPDE